MPNSQWRSRIGRRPHLHVSASKGLRILPVKFFSIVKTSWSHKSEWLCMDSQSHWGRNSHTSEDFVSLVHDGTFYLGLFHLGSGWLVLRKWEVTKWFLRENPGVSRLDLNINRTSWHPEKNRGTKALPGHTFFQATKWLSSTRLSTRSCYVPGKKVLTLTLV